MKTCLTLLLCTCVLSNAIAWGTDGHTVIGMLAVKHLDSKALNSLDKILDDTEHETIAEACNWPDVYRETDEGATTSGYHYVNIPRSQSAYDRQRDCAGGNCVTEQIKHFAAELENPRLDKERRKLAFSWVCHLVGDLHQPLHAGFADDRGGNSVDVTFNDEPMNLHAFWDTGLISSFGLSSSQLVMMLDPVCVAGTSDIWALSSVDEWTEESHALVAEHSYPACQTITDDFSQQSWVIVRQQLVKAASRLAVVVNATIGKGEVSPRD